MRLAATGAFALVLGAGGALAAAPIAKVAPQGGANGADQNAPVTFQADSVSYDGDPGIITGRGHVVAWQNDNVLRADRVTFDRNTNVAAAYGHVAIVQPDGEVLFSDYAELTQGMRNGVLKGMRTLMLQNAKMAANGARRVEGKVNDYSRAVYTPCDVCAAHPDAPPLWQLRAADATQDLEHKRIDYQDTYLDIYGVPVFYLPFFSMSDPSVRRQSGFLMPDVAPSDDYLGPFARIPYYWVIGPSSDATFTPLLATKSGPQLTTEYRRDFNSGTIRITGAVAYDTSTTTKGSDIVPADLAPLDSVEGYIFAHANFVWNDEWHYGADINLATSARYMRDYQVPGYGADVLGSTAFVEGFSEGSFTRLDALAFQGINQGVVVDADLPFVLPRYTYDLLLAKDPLGGRLRVTSEDFDIYRPDGGSDERAGLVINWDRPLHGPLGTMWTLTGNLQSEVYAGDKLNLLPDYYTGTHSDTVQALPTAALRVEWPLVRLPRGGGSQTLEPIVQLLAAPNPARSAHDELPNEDSLDYDFSDTTLFSLNRFQGIDRQDGGMRANVGLHGNWTFANGMYLDGLAGESFRTHVDNRDMIPGSGLERHSSDIVDRLSFVPARWLDFTGRTRYDHDHGKLSFADGLATVGVKLLRVSAGYLYSSTNPYYYYDTNFRVPADILPGFYLPRNELTLGANSNFGHWSLGAYARRNLSNRQYTGYTGFTEGEKFVALGGGVGWQNNCFGVNLNYSKRYTYINGDNGDQTILVTFTFKTLGSFGFNG